MKHPFVTTMLGTVLACTSVAFAAQNDNRDVVHNSYGLTARNTFGNCVRTQWMNTGDECGARLEAAPAPVKKAIRQISDEERTVYFEFNKAHLAQSERAKLDTLTAALKSADDISGVSIVGYADRIGTASYNERLSQQRAQNVEHYLRAHGCLNTNVAQTQWLGESVPVTQCPDSLDRQALIACLQRDRRVTVEITYEDVVVVP